MTQCLHKGMKPGGGRGHVTQRQATGDLLTLEQKEDRLPQGCG